MRAAEIARQLGGHRSGGGWVAKCPGPGHDDHKPSLSLTEKAGRLLVHCHAGCRQADVIEALKNLGLWERAEKPIGEALRRIVAEYNYTDEYGELLYQVVRFEPKD